jgi:methyl coenzyme M reductase subunit C
VWNAIKTAEITLYLGVEVVFHAKYSLGDVKAVTPEEVARAFLHDINVIYANPGILRGQLHIPEDATEICVHIDGVNYSFPIVVYALKRAEFLTI